MAVSTKLPVLKSSTRAREKPKRIEAHLKPPKRSLTLRFARLAKGVPMVLLAVTGPAGGCYVHHRVEPSRDAGTDARDVRDAPDAPPPDFGTPDAGLCYGEELFTVNIPSPGVPADATQICIEPDEAFSRDAARVVLVFDDDGDHRIARGTITIEDGLLPDLIGLPELEFINVSGISVYFGMTTLGPVTRDGDEFTFELRADGEPWSFPPRDERAEFNVRFDLDCGDGSTRRVVSTTIVHLCLEDDGTLTFASSGEECRACAIIAEMAPTPIIPAQLPDTLPLQRGMELRLRPIARFDNAVVLLAEHSEGSRGVSYDWHATRGRLHEVEPDVVLWELSPDAQDTDAVQVVVETSNSASIATFRRTEQ